MWMRLRGDGMGAKKIAYCGILVALTLILSYVERLIPFGFGIPGIKLGLANIAVIIALYLLGSGTGVLIGIIRAVINGILFTGASAMLYSLAGALLSVAVMLPMSGNHKFGVVGTSVAGAASHIIGQVAVAQAMLGSGVLAWFPVMLLSAVATGSVNGLIAGNVIVYLGRDKNILGDRGLSK